MKFTSLLCTIFSRLDGEKSVNAAYHLLRGKRSGQTIQDVQYYQLQMFFGILPKLSKTIFDDAIKEIEALDYIRIDHNDILHMTVKGQEVVQKVSPFYFNGWHYRGREEIFFARLSLIVQTLSHFRVGVKQFMPIHRNPEVQQFVKQFLRGYPIEEASFSNQFKKEFMAALERSGMENIQKTIMTYRLVGYGMTGWTWGQLGEQLNQSSLNVKLSFIESLHRLLQTIEQNDDFLLLKKIAIGIRVETLLTESTRKTKSYFDKGYTLEEISATRQLKLSTIEDHIVEMALNDEHFPLKQFVSLEDYRIVQEKSRALKTKRLRVLKETFPQLSYFQLRLILSLPTKGVETVWTSKES